MPSLPDRFEQGGVVVGAALLLALPTSALSVAFLGLAQPPLAVAAWFVPGLVVGWLTATDRLPTSYDGIWLFSLVSDALTFGGWKTVGAGFPPADRAAGVGVWLAALAVAATVAHVAPTTHHETRRTA